MPDLIGDTTGTQHAQTDDMRAQERYAWRVLSVTALGVLLTGINASTLTVALPVVAEHFAASATQASWILLSYMLVTTVLLLVVARLSDLLGRRTPYLAGLTVFTIAGLLCGFAPSADVLIALRAVQAAGAAAIIVNTTAMLTDVFPRRLLGVALGLNITIVSGAQVLGPVVGGALATAFGWRAVFWFNVPFGVVGVVWAALTLRPTPRGPRSGRFDLAGALLSVLAIGGLVVLLSEGGAVGWSNVWVLVAAVTTVISLPAFVLVQRRRQDPLVDLRLFDDRPRALAYAATFLLAIAEFSVVLVASLFLQAAQGLNPFQAGLRVLPVAVGMMFTSPIAGRLTDRVSARVLATTGLGICAGGLLVLAITLSPTTPYPVLGAGLLAVGIGTGLFLTPNTSAIMGSVPPERRGVANGVRSMLLNAGFVVSTAMTLAIVTGPLSPLEKRATYAGTLSSLPGGDLARYVDGNQVALTVLLGLCLLAAVASYLRGPRGAAQT